MNPSSVHQLIRTVWNVQSAGESGFGFRFRLRFNYLRYQVRSLQDFDQRDPQAPSRFTTVKYLYVFLYCPPKLPGLLRFTLFTSATPSGSEWTGGRHPRYAMCRMETIKGPTGYWQLEDILLANVLSPLLFHFSKYSFYGLVLTCR